MIGSETTSHDHRSYVEREVRARKRLVLSAQASGSILYVTFSFVYLAFSRIPIARRKALEEMYIFLSRNPDARLVSHTEQQCIDRKIRSKNVLICFRVRMRQISRK